MKANKIIILTQWFVPGHKAGGPIQAALNLAKTLSSHLSIYVITLDRDIHEPHAYPNIVADEWHCFQENVDVIYLSPKNSGFNTIKNLINTINPISIFLNGIFPTQFAIYPLLMKRLGLISCNVVVSPRGMLKSSALAFSSFKKKACIGAIKLFNLPNVITFHATDKQEESDIFSTFGKNVSVKQAFDLPAASYGHKIGIEKHQGKLKCLFFGRIHPIKNIDFIFELFTQNPELGLVEFSVAGPIEDDSYWLHCQKLINRVSSKVEIIYKGNLSHPEILKEISLNHLIVIPSKGENFGYSIIEALSLGRPVLISDQTPWRNLEAYKAGWDISLLRSDIFVDAIKTAINWDQDAFDAWSSGSKKYISQKIDIENAKKEYLDILGFNNEYYTNLSLEN
jgi:glycosyltransferase involved in cell wall biosynthesis